MTTVTLLNHEPPYNIKFVPDSKTAEIAELIAHGYENLGHNKHTSPPPQVLNTNTTPIQSQRQRKLTSDNMGGSRRRRPSRKYKKSKRVFRKKSRSTRRR